MHSWISMGLLVQGLMPNLLPKSACLLLLLQLPANPRKSLSTPPLVNLGWQVKDMYYEIINGKGLPKQHAFLATANPDLSYLDYFEDSGFHFDGSLSGGKRSYEEEANEATTCGAMKKICMGMPRAAILGARQMRRSM